MRAVGRLHERHQHKGGPLLPTRPVVYLRFRPHHQRFGVIREDFAGMGVLAVPSDYGSLDAPEWLPEGSTVGWDGMSKRIVFAALHSRETGSATVPAGTGGAERGGAGCGEGGAGAAGRGEQGQALKR